MTVKYRVAVRLFVDDQDTEGVEILNVLVDEAHEIAPKLAALYPPPAPPKRQHRRKAAVEATP